MKLMFCSCIKDWVVFTLSLTFYKLRVATEWINYGLLFMAMTTYRYIHRLSNILPSYVCIAYYFNYLVNMECESAYGLTWILMQCILWCCILRSYIGSDITCNDLSQSTNWWAYSFLKKWLMNLKIYRHILTYILDIILRCGKCKSIFIGYYNNNVMALKFPAFNMVVSAKPKHTYEHQCHGIVTSDLEHWLRSNTKPTCNATALVCGVSMCHKQNMK